MDTPQKYVFLQYYIHFLFRVCKYTLWQNIHFHVLHASPCTHYNSNVH